VAGGIAPAGAFVRDIRGGGVLLRSAGRSVDMVAELSAAAFALCAAGTAEVLCDPMRSVRIFSDSGRDSADVVTWAAAAGGVAEGSGTPVASAAAEGGACSKSSW
jgi:hypothetical protein